MTATDLDLIAKRPAHRQPGKRLVAVSPEERDALVSLATLGLQVVGLVEQQKEGNPT